MNLPRLIHPVWSSTLSRRYGRNGKKRLHNAAFLRRLKNFTGSDCQRTKSFNYKNMSIMNNNLCLDLRRVELLTLCLQSRRSTRWATGPQSWKAKANFNFEIWYHFFVFNEKKWALMGSNHRPQRYQHCALASWAKGPWSRRWRDKFHIPISKFQKYLDLGIWILEFALI